MQTLLTRGRKTFNFFTLQNEFKPKKNWFWLFYTRFNWFNRDGTHTMCHNIEGRKNWRKRIKGDFCTLLSLLVIKWKVIWRNCFTAKFLMPPLFYDPATVMRLHNIDRLNVLSKKWSLKSNQNFFETVFLNREF